MVSSRSDCQMWADIEYIDNSGDSYSKVNGNPAVMLSIEKQTGYSTGDVTDRLLDKFDSLEKENTALHFERSHESGYLH